VKELSALEGWKRSLIDIDQLSSRDIEWIIQTAKSFDEVSRRAVKKVPTLRGKTVVNLFYEPSTRTRMSFELAAKRLSADVLNFSTDNSSVAKGEGLKDTVLTLQAMGVDALVVRHPVAGAPELISRWVEVSVINAGDGMHAHPTQALLDVYSLHRRLGDLDGKTIGMVGDILHSRVARSNIQAMTMMGAKLILVAPPTLMPRDLGGWKVETSYMLDEVIDQLDVIYLLRLQLERQEEGLVPSLEEYAHYYQLNADRLARARKDVIVMHPGPMNRGVEIAAEIAEHPCAIILDQVTNGVAVRMAVLIMLLGGREPGGKVHV
jgi:aspartate carbamoyltransferase catalytic subunit